VLEVAHVEDGKCQLDKAKMTWAIEEAFLARLTVVHTFGGAHADVFGAPIEWRESVVFVQSVLANGHSGAAMQVLRSQKTELD